jgi:hypothetical protein
LPSSDFGQLEEGLRSHFTLLAPRGCRKACDCKAKSERPLRSLHFVSLQLIDVNSELPGQLEHKKNSKAEIREG